MVKKVLLSQMVDLALKTPEVGVVNFNIIHIILQTIVSKTNLSDIEVEFDEKGIGGFKTNEPAPSGKTARSNNEPQQIAGDDTLAAELNDLKSNLQELYDRVGHLENAAVTTPMSDLEENLSTIEELKSQLMQMTTMYNKAAEADEGKVNFGVNDKIIKLETDLSTQNKNLMELQTLVTAQINEITKQLQDLEKDFGVINERLNVQSQSNLEGDSSTAVSLDQTVSEGSKKPSIEKQDVGHLVTELYSRLNSLQQDMDQLVQTTALLAEDKENLELRFDSIKEELEVLKTVKADRMEMEDVLACKADVAQVIRKVSHTDFQNKVDDFNVNFDSAFAKLNEHESQWIMEKENVFKNIDLKVDKSEMEPVKEYLTENVKMLLEKVNALSVFHKADQAAGAIQRKVIKDLNCIACEKDVVMNENFETSDLKVPDGMKAHPSIKPFLTYKLDQVRRQQQKLPTGRNLLHFEEMMQSADPRYKKSPQPAPAVQVDSALHICNRYCGGSHTVTTPLQRVTRTGHFFTEFGSPSDNPKPTDSPRNAGNVNPSEPISANSNPSPGGNIQAQQV